MPISRAFGIALFVAHLFAGVLSGIVTIPFGIQSFKLGGLSFWPVGRRVVSVELARAAREHNAKIKLGKMVTGVLTPHCLLSPDL
ncbi:YccF domain-containing protein [Rhizobium leguminosarum]|uniref:YccF domain-containing protein n=1 Tax=Rhizobium leguminosarum TaxID=384 RepID=UPI0021BBE186|nr:YccF domain-containing protein [Rhizobium leguminosarum]